MRRKGAISGGKKTVTSASVVCAAICAARRYATIPAASSTSTLLGSRTTPVSQKVEAHTIPASLRRAIPEKVT